MKILKVVALLLHYPNDELQEHVEEMLTLIQQSQQILPDTGQDLVNYLATQQHSDLLDRQAEYVALFDRGRALSLHLFEHVHGESRDRGQAMVNLLEEYRQHGFIISSNELPDYLPLFLEFCSYLPDTEVQRWLSDIEHLLQVLHKRLEIRESHYAILFRVLLELAGSPLADSQLSHKLKSEERDDTPRALDNAWAEAPVIFGPSAGCGGDLAQGGQAIPIDISGLRQRRS